jgi:flagellar hook-basal body complex protein FliE
MAPIASTPSIHQVQSLTDAVSKLPLGTSAAGAPATGHSTFGSLMDHLVQTTNQDQLASDQAITQMVTGETDNIQQVVLAVAKAELSFQLFMDIRNKLIDSYNELMRMQF